MIQSSADIGRRILEAARIAMLIHQEEERTELVGENAAQGERLNGVDPIIK
jgi:hypothetical protein